MIRTDIKTIITIGFLVIVIFILTIIATARLIDGKYNNNLNDLRNNIDSLYNKIEYLENKNDSLTQNINSIKRSNLSKLAGIKIPKTFTYKHINYLEEQCRLYNIPLKIVARLIYVESSYNKSAKSHVGASGYMQLMPKTYSHFSKKLGIVENNEYSNIKVGVYYLSHLYKMFNNFSNTNRWGLTLLSYNMGPTRVKKDPMKYLDYALNYSYVKKILNI